MSANGRRIVRSCLTFGDFDRCPTSDFSEVIFTYIYVRSWCLSPELVSAGMPSARVVCRAFLAGPYSAGGGASVLLRVITQDCQALHTV